LLQNDIITRFLSHRYQKLPTVKNSGFLAHRVYSVKGDFQTLK